MTAPATRPMALITTDLRPGGAERCLTQLAIGLATWSWRPHVYCLSAAPPPDRCQLVDRLLAARIPVRFLRASRTWHALSAIRELRSAWRDDGIVLVQSFLFHANTIASVVCRQLGIPCVGGLRVQEIRRTRQCVQRAQRRGFRHVVCVSHSVAQQAQQQLRFPKSRLSVIPNSCTVDDGPCSDLDQRSQLGLRIDRRYILFAGRIDRQKGIDRVIEHLPRFLDRQGDTDLLIVGDGPLRARLQQRTAHGKYQHRVVWCGWQEDVRAWMRACQVVFVPSRWEGMPNIVLEAMAAGRPVVGTDVDGMGEALGTQRERQIVPRQAIDSMAECIAYWLDHPAEAMAQGEANRQRIRRDFSPHEMIRRYAELYEQILTEAVA